MSQPKRSRFWIRRRILEVLLLLWVANYLYERFQRTEPAALAPAPTATTPAPWPR